MVDFNFWQRGNYLRTNQQYCLHSPLHQGKKGVKGGMSVISLHNPRSGWSTRGNGTLTSCLLLEATRRTALPPMLSPTSQLTQMSRPTASAIRYLAKDGCVICSSLSILYFILVDLYWEFGLLRCCSFPGVIWWHDRLRQWECKLSYLSMIYELDPRHTLILMIYQLGVYYADIMPVAFCTALYQY